MIRRLRGNGLWLFPLLALHLPAQPGSLQVRSDALPRVARATRSEMLGLVDLYELALYAPRHTSGLAALRREQTPKALRIAITYDGSLLDNIPSDWKRELRPALTDPQETAVRNAYGELHEGDEILVRYRPPTGTDIVVSGKRVVTAAGHDVMAAFLNIWLGQTPVSEDIKRELLDRLAAQQ